MFYHAALFFGNKLIVLDAATGASWNNLHEILDSFPNQSRCSDCGFCPIDGHSGRNDDERHL